MFLWPLISRRITCHCKRPIQFHRTSHRRVAKVGKSPCGRTKRRALVRLLMQWMMQSGRIEVATVQITSSTFLLSARIARLPEGAAFAHKAQIVIPRVQQAGRIPFAVNGIASFFIIHNDRLRLSVPASDSNEIIPLPNNDLISGPNCFDLRHRMMFPWPAQCFICRCTHLYGHFCFSLLPVSFSFVSVSFNFF